MLVTGKFEASLYIFKGIAYFIGHIHEIWHKRANVQWNLRKISDKELLPIILRNPPMSYYINRFFHYISTGMHG